MAYTETHYTSWFDRLKNSVAGILTGIALIAFASWLLWWNEGDTFKTAGAIGEAELVTQDVPDISNLNSELEGKVIHATGFATTDEVLNDPIFGIKATAIKLERDVEFYQWHENSRTEKRKKLGGGEEEITTYTYDKGWSSSKINSSNFHDPSYRDKNFTLADVDDNTIVAQNVKFGAYKLPSFLKNQIGGAKPITINEYDKEAIKNILHVPSNYVYTNFNGVEALIHASGSVIYLGAEPSNPKIGDVRITFKETPPADITIIAQVLRDTFEEFRASNGYRFSRLSMGTVGQATMFEDARSENNLMAWVFRAVGAALVMIGLGMIFKPLSVLLDVIPILGDIVGAGAGVVSFILGLVWSLIVIAIAWLRYRPLVAGILIAVAVVLMILLRGKGKKAKEF